MLPAEPQKEFQQFGLLCRSVFEKAADCALKIDHIQSAIAAVTRVAHWRRCWKLVLRISVSVWSSHLSRAATLA